MAPALIAAAAALLICLLRMPIARTMALVDTPDQPRKRHVGPVPLVGGIAVFPAIAIAIVQAVALDASDGAGAVMVGVIFGFFMIGYADDRVHIRPSRRLLLTLILFAALILVSPGFMPETFRIDGLALDFGAGAVALLAILGASGALNAINMADGQDGLGPGLLLVWLVFLATLPSPAIQGAAIVTAAGVLALLGFNLAGKVFLGDMGAYGIGAFVLALMLQAVGKGVMDHGQIVALLAVPVTDCIFLMIERARLGHSPFDADRRHLHHILQASVGIWPSLILYLGAVALCALGAAANGWVIYPTIAGGIAFAVAVRLFGRRDPPMAEAAAAEATQTAEAA